MSERKSVFTNLWHKIQSSQLTGRLLGILIVIAALAVAMILSGPKPPDDFNPLVTATQEVISQSATNAAPPRITSSEYKLTDGVVFAVVMVVVIILTGTLLTLNRNAKKTRSQ